MALIKCPECGKEISSYAPMCIHCGYPIKDLGMNLPKEGDDIAGDKGASGNGGSEIQKPTGSCPICKASSQSAVFNSGISKYQCKICGYTYGSLPGEGIVNQVKTVPEKRTVRVSKRPTDSCPNCKAPSDKFELSKEKNLKYVCFVCGYIHPFINGIDVEEDHLDDYIEKHSIPRKVTSTSTKSGSTPWDTKYYNYPCPYCGMYKVRPAKWEDKRLSIAFWGAIASSKTGARYKCESCNRMWS